VRVEPFQPFHLDILRAQGVQGSQLLEVSQVPANSANLKKPDGPAVTAFDGNRILVCGGIATMGPKRGACWALLAADSGRHMLALHRAVGRFITLQPWQRLEATVEKGFGAGCRWVELLGFEFEGEMKAYGTHGETHLRYARTWPL
jgi:hypothetical protein